MKKTVVTFLSVLLLLLPVNQVASEEPPAETALPSASIQEAGEQLTQVALSEDYIQVAENNSFALYVNITDCQIVLLEKESGREWLSFPNATDETGFVEQFKCLIRISFLDTRYNVVTVDSFSECVQNDSYEIRKIKDGVKFTFDFNKNNQCFRVPMQVTINEDSMEASLLYDEIEEYGESRICEIDLLPYFGAGSANEDGYLLIPDGSGALVRFSDSTDEAVNYRQTVYGADPAVGLMLKSAEPLEQIHMPVFGIQKSGGAFLAVAHEGATASAVYARNSDKNWPYASAGFSFGYHQYDITGIRDKRGGSRQVPVTQEAPFKITPTVRWYFLNQDSADYSGMARQYRSYLKETGHLSALTEENASAVSLLVYGQTQKKSSFLGIPITKNVTVTSFAQTEDILRQLRESGVNNPNVFLYGFEKGGYQKQYNKTESFASGLGGKRGYQSLLKSAGEATIFQSKEFTRDYKTSVFKAQYIKSLNRISIERRQPLISTGEWDFDGISWRYIRPHILLKNITKWFQSVTVENNAGVLFSGMGQELYSDFDDNRAPGRDRTLDTYRQAFEIARKKGLNTSAEGGNVYLADLANVLIDIPTASSGHDIFSEDVPFYAMVLHGYVELASKPVNRLPDRSAVLPSMVAAGIAPTYQLTAINTSRLKDTAFNFLYSSEADAWMEEIAAVAKDYEVAQNGLANVPISSHKRRGGLEIFTYENGAVVIGNIGGEADQYEGIEILPGKVVRIK